MRDDTHTFDEAVTDPQPRFASADEIALAERLRRQIEERYLNKNGHASHEAQPFKKAA